MTTYGPETIADLHAVPDSWTPVLHCLAVAPFAVATTVALLKGVWHLRNRRASRDAETVAAEKPVETMAASQP